jgi:hypothetical protein
MKCFHVIYATSFLYPDLLPPPHPDPSITRKITSGCCNIRNTPQHMQYANLSQKTEKMLLVCARQTSCLFATCWTNPCNIVKSQSHWPPMLTYEALTFAYSSSQQQIHNWLTLGHTLLLHACLHPLLLTMSHPSHALTPPGFPSSQAMSHHPSLPFTKTQPHVVSHKKNVHQ